MRLLKRLGQHLEIVEGMETATKVEAWIAPGLQHDLDSLVEADVTFVWRHAESAELARIEAAAGAPIDAASGQNIEQGDFLGEAHRMIERGERHCGADAKPLGASGSVGTHHGDRGAHAIIVEVMLGEPDS